MQLIKYSIIFLEYSEIYKTMFQVLLQNTTLSVSLKPTLTSLASLFSHVPSASDSEIGEIRGLFPDHCDELSFAGLESVFRVQAGNPQTPSVDKFRSIPLVFLGPSSLYHPRNNLLLLCDRRWRSTVGLLPIPVLCPFRRHGSGIDAPSLVIGKQVQHVHPFAGANVPERC